MAALTANYDTKMDEIWMSTYGVAADAVIFIGALLVCDGGYVRPVGADETSPFVGIALYDVDATDLDDGDVFTGVVKVGVHHYPIDTAAVTDIGAKLYADTDGSVTLTGPAAAIPAEGETPEVPATHVPEVGYLVGINDDGTARVRIDRSVC